MSVPSVVVPDLLIQKNLHARGALAPAWLERLPAIVAEFAARWSLTVERAFPNLTYNYVTPVRRADGSSAVLKVFPSFDPEAQAEVDALRVYAGRGAVRIFEGDREGGAILIEQILPGTSLRAMEDDVEATRIAAGVMRVLRHPPPAEHVFPTVGQWAEALAQMREKYEGGTGPLPEALVARAEAIYAELLPSMAEPIVLHGDLHHDNILAAGEGTWLAIDPQGVIGEPAYEVGALLRNTWGRVAAGPELDRITARRVIQLADELALDRQRVRDWGLAQAVLSACWSMSSPASSHGAQALAIAGALARIRV